MDATKRHNRDIKRFWERVEKIDPNECWNWMGAFFSNGYGVFTVAGKAVRAHRFCWRLTKGEIPEGAFVCHACDNPKCVNPSHLWLGSAKDNTQDMMIKGRWDGAKKGDDHWSRKRPELVARGMRHSSITHPERTQRGIRHYATHLTEEDVVHIRLACADGEKTQAISERFKISRAAVNKIRSRKSWKHVQ